MNNLFDLFNIKYQDNLGLSGMTDESFCLLTYELFKKENRSILIVASNLTDANNLLNIFTSFSNDTLLLSSFIIKAPFSIIIKNGAYFILTNHLFYQ